jgi:hypothetical protein
VRIGEVVVVVIVVFARVSFTRVMCGEFSVVYSITEEERCLARVLQKNQEFFRGILLFYYYYLFPWFTLHQVGVVQSPG